MPANSKVSVAWQIVFTFLPVVNFWAFYRIRKLRKYVLYVFVPEITITIIYWWYVIGPILAAMMANPPVDTSGLVSYAADPTLTAVTSVTSWGLQGLSIYLVIIWSRLHNRRVDASTGQAPAT